jgi:hypothetical protein
MQYSNFKDTLQNIASQIGNVEQEVEEHKYVIITVNVSCFREPYGVSSTSQKSQFWLRLQQSDNSTNQYLQHIILLIAQHDCKNALTQSAYVS